MSQPIEDPIDNDATERSRPPSSDDTANAASTEPRNAPREREEAAAGAAGADGDNFRADESDYRADGDASPSTSRADRSSDAISRPEPAPPRDGSPPPSRAARPSVTKPPRPEGSPPPAEPARRRPPQSRTDALSDWRPFADEVRAPEAPSLAASAPSDLSALRALFDTEYERAVLRQEIAWKARYAATRLSFLLSCLSMLLYLWMGCMFYRSEAGWSVPDALLFTVYTVTTVGYGGPRPLPDTAAFHAFTSAYVLAGISGVTVLGAHTYQLVMLEATRIRGSPLKSRRSEGGREREEEEDGFRGDEEGAVTERFRRQFMNELEDRVRERPALDRALDGIIRMAKDVRHYLETTRSGRVLAVMLPFVGMILLGAVVVGLIEGWTPLESIYWSIVTLTTVGYGDYTPTQKSSVWFCTLFFIPSSLFFLSFFLAHVAKSYIRIHAIHVARLERRMRDKEQRKRDGAERAERATRNANAAGAGRSDATNTSAEQALPTESPGASSDADETESGFTTISYTEDEDIANGRRTSMGLFGEETGMDSPRSQEGAPNQFSLDTSPGMRYRENVVRNKFAAPDPNGRRAISFGEALQSLDQSPHTQSSGESTQPDQGSSPGKPQKRSDNKPSLELRMRVQERVAKIIAEEVAGYQSDVTIKGSTVSLTISTLRETAEKWKIPPQAWKAFRAISFRCLLFVGERDLISDGGEALLRLNAIEFHGIFSPMLAAMGDGPMMEEWLGKTDILADAEFGDGRGRVARGNVFGGTFT